MRRRIQIGAVIAVAALVAAGCADGTQSAGGDPNSAEPPATAVPTNDAGGTETSEDVDLSGPVAALEDANFTQVARAVEQANPADDLPFSAELKDGSTFTLKESIAEKVRNGEEINYVFSYQSSGIPLFSDQYSTGYKTTLPIASEIYPMAGTAIAPAGDIDIPQQTAQIEALLNTGQIDCLTIQPPDSDAFTAITNQAMADGIPVFTVGVTSNGNEFTNFTQVPLEEGHKAAEVVLEWMEAEGKDLKVFTVSGGDPSAFWAQGRMKGFEEGIKEAIPDAKFLNTAEDPLSVTYDPAQTYDAYNALLTGQTDLDFILSVDIGAEHAARAIKDAGKEGEVFTAGWNVSLAQLDAIEEGTQVAAFDQRWSEQAGFGAAACATLFATGKITPNTQELGPVTADNVDEARADLEEVLGGG